MRRPPTDRPLFNRALVAVSGGPALQQSDNFGSTRLVSLVCSLSVTESLLIRALRPARRGEDERGLGLCCWRGRVYQATPL